jgi:class 3 adenylate cyclase
MAKVSEPIRETIRLFGRHDRFSAYLLFIAVLLVCLYQEVASKYAIYAIPVLAVLPFILTRVQWNFHRRYGDDRAPVPVLISDAFAAGVCVALSQFSVVPSLVFACVLVFDLAGITSGVLWVSSLVVAASGMFATAYALSLQTDAFHVTPVLSSVVAVVCLAAYVIVELMQARVRVENADAQVEEANAKASQFMNIANKIARYAPSQVWQSIVRGDRDAKIENKRKKLTIFFSDIQGFTELSESLLPDDLATILNTYFEHMSDLAKKYGGTIDKFIGDALLIFFGDPTTQGPRNDALACVEMAIAMRRENKLLRQKWKALGFDGLHVRMGITTGYCHVGNFGSNSRMSYTIIGRDANLAARLQGAADPDEILISNDTYLLIRDRISCRERGLMQLKGISKPMQTWQVIDQFQNTQTYNRRWMEFEMDGFNLQLDMDEVKTYDRERIMQALQQASRNLDVHKPGEGKRSD